MGNKHAIAYVNNPARFYAENEARLNAVGGSAFSQDSAAFGGQVAERFGKSEIAQSMHVGDELVGFALYTLIRGHLWR